MVGCNLTSLIDDTQQTPKKTVLKCKISNCQCEQFRASSISVRSCDECKHSYVSHALNRQTSYTNLQSHCDLVSSEHIFEIATLCLYGCTTVTTRIKILLDRLFQEIHTSEKEQILKNLRWTINDYNKSYVEQNFSTHNNISFHLVMTSPEEEEQFLIPQFLRFDPTRLLAQYFLQIAHHHRRTGSGPFQPQSPSASSSLIPHSSSSPTIKQELKSNTLTFPTSTPATTTATPPLIRPPLPFPTTMPWFPTPAHVPPGTTPISATPSDFRCPQPSDLQFLNLLIAHFSTPLTMNYDFRRIGNNLQPTTMINEQNNNETKTNGNNTNINGSSTNGSLIKQQYNNENSNNDENNIKKQQHSLLNFQHQDSLKTFNTKNISHQRHLIKRKRIDQDDVLNLSSKASPPSPTASEQQPLPLITTPSSRLSDSSLSSTSSTTPGLNGSGTTNNHHHQRKRFSLSEQRILVSPHGKKRVQCHVCMKTFCDKGALKIHFSAVHLREMHKCTTPGCTMMFSSRRSRNRHSANPNPKLHMPRPNAISHRYQSTGPIISDGQQSQAGIYLAQAERIKRGEGGGSSYSVTESMVHDEDDDSLQVEEEVEEESFYDDNNNHHHHHNVGADEEDSRSSSTTNHQRLIKMEQNQENEESEDDEHV